MLILLDENETTFYDGHLDFAKHQSSGVELRMTFQRKETGTFQQKETGEAEKKMEVKIIDENSTLKEVQELCKSKENCESCPFYEKTGCRLRLRPDEWDLNSQHRFSENELAWMRVMVSGLTEEGRMWLGRKDTGTLYWKIENRDGGDGWIGSLPKAVFPQIQPGQWHDVRKVLERDEQ